MFDPFNLFSGLINFFGSLFGGKMTNDANLQAVRETNAANLQAVRETNTANVQQSELAYSRSLPQNQLLNLMNTGLSRQGALNLMNGTNGGVYSVPQLSTAHAEPARSDYSFVSNALRELGNIPANTMQRRLQEQQFKNIEDEIQLRRERFELERKAMHERLQRERDEELRKQYGQNVVEMTDKLSQQIDKLAAKYGVKFSDLRSEDDLIDKLHLNDEPLWRTAPAAARQNAVDSARQRNSDWLAQNADDRATQQQNNENTASSDIHKIQQQLLKKYKKEYEKLEQEVREWKLETSVRSRERSVRAMTATYNSMVAQSNIAREELEQAIEFYRDDDGNIKANIPQGVSAEMSAFWNMVLSIIPVEALIKILGRSLK